LTNHERREQKIHILIDSPAPSANDPDSGETVGIEIIKKQTLDETKDAKLIQESQQEMRFQEHGQM
jgi:hypothetical protein